MGLSLNLVPAINAAKELTTSIHRLAKAHEDANEIERQKLKEQ